MFQIRRSFWQLSTLIANISGTDPEIENRKSSSSTTTPPTLGEIKLVNFGPQTKKLLTCILTHLSGHCSGARLYFGPYGVMCPQIFIRTTDCRRLANAYPNWDGGPPPSINNDENLKFGLKFSVCAPITSGIVGYSNQTFLGHVLNFGPQTKKL